MITDFLAKAIEIGADRIEIEHKDRAELVTAFHGPVGVGIAWVDATHWDGLFQEMQDLKKLGKQSPPHFPQVRRYLVVCGGGGWEGGVTRRCKLNTASGVLWCGVV